MSDGGHLDELNLARLLAGDGGWWARRRARHLDRCPSCRARLAEARAARATYEADPARAAETRALIRAASSIRAPKPARWPWLLVPTLAAAGALLALSPIAHPPDAGEAPGGLRAKGADVFAMYLARGDESGPLPDRCAPGDRLRARLEGPGRWVYVIGVDPTGAVTPLLPDDGDDSLALGDDPLWSPGSWILDAAPGTERFIAAFSDGPLSLADVVDAVEAQAADPLTPVPGLSLVEHRCTKPARWGDR